MHPKLVEPVQFKCILNTNYVRNVIEIQNTFSKPLIYRVGQKSGPQTHGHNSVESEPIFKKLLVIKNAAIPCMCCYTAL